jgi:hypothetical protein
MPVWVKAIGVVLVIGGGILVSTPGLVRDALGRTPATPSDWINLRATFGGTLVGLGVFLIWLPGWSPWQRTVQGLLLWSMAGIGIARLIGFLLDGSPDTRQWIWLVAEIVIVAVTGFLLYRRGR